jgi:hypothetical protein
MKGRAVQPLHSFITDKISPLNFSSWKSVKPKNQGIGVPVRSESDMQTRLIIPAGSPFTPL